MVYAVQGVFGFRNTARRDAVMQNVQNRLSAEITWGEVITTPFDSGAKITDPSMYVEVRFSTDAARDAFWTDVIAFLGTGVNGPVVGSFIEQHDCPHDENSADSAMSLPCIAGERVNY
jgi:hypothetical protein